MKDTCKRRLANDRAGRGNHSRTLNYLVLAVGHRHALSQLLVTGHGDTRDTLESRPEIAMVKICVVCVLSERRGRSGLEEKGW
jgi:hypothetical protein